MYASSFECCDDQHYDEMITYSRYNQIRNKLLVITTRWWILSYYYLYYVCFFANSFTFSNNVVFVVARGFFHFLFCSLFEQIFHLGVKCVSSVLLFIFCFCLHDSGVFFFFLLLMSFVIAVVIAPFFCVLCIHSLTRTLYTHAFSIESVVFSAPN